MDSDKYSTQVERLGVVETGRRRRWTDDEKLKIVLESMQSAAGDFVDGAALRHLALAFAELATIFVHGAGRRCGSSDPVLCRRWSWRIRRRHLLLRRRVAAW